MINRRALMSGLSVSIVINPHRSEAIVPAVLAVIASITALALATSKAADALDKVVERGETMWKRFQNMSDALDARLEMHKKKLKIEEEMEIRRQVINDGMAMQSRNADVVSVSERYVINPIPENWRAVQSAISKASSALQDTSKIFREKAVWFPPEAQDALGEIPNLYDKRENILYNISKLGNDNSPQNDVKSLIVAYDNLRIQSLKLIVALRRYYA